MNSLYLHILHIYALPSLLMSLDKISQVRLATVNANEVKCAESESCCSCPALRGIWSGSKSGGVSAVRLSLHCDWLTWMCPSHGGCAVATRARQRARHSEPFGPSVSGMWWLCRCSVHGDRQCASRDSYRMQFESSGVSRAWPCLLLQLHPQFVPI